MTATKTQPVELTEPTVKTESAMGRISEAVKEWANQPVAPGASREEMIGYVKPLAPVVAVALAASAARSGMESSGADAEIALVVAVAAFAAAVVWGMRLRRTVVRKAFRARTYAMLAAAAGWTMAALATGVTEPMMYVLTVVGVGLSLWQWNELPLGYGWSPAPKVDMPATGVDVDVFATRWETNLAAPGKILAGTRLTDGELLKFGARYALEVKPGVHELDMVESHMKLIRSGLRLRRSHKIMLEEHPTREAPTLQLTIIDTAPVAGGVSWPGVSAMNRDGTIDIGPYVDGEGRAKWKLYSKNRIHNGFIAGVTGSGKSQLLENIAMTAAGNDLFPTAVWYADGQDGASSAKLMQHADYSACKPEKILALLKEAINVIKLQGEENFADHRQGFTPTPDRPGLLVILDECKLVLDKNNNPEFYEETQWAVAKIATTGNKAGVGIILAGQEATLPTLGGAGQFPAAIRNNIKGANGILMKTEESAATNIFNVPALLAKSVPAGGGYGLVAGEDGSRRAIMRGYWDDDEIQAQNMASLRWRTISGVTALDLTTAYRDRKLSVQEDIEAARARVEARRRRHQAVLRGELLVEDEPATQIEVPAPPRRVSASQFTTFTIPTLFWKAKGADAVLTAGQDRVLQAVLAGHTGWQEIGQAAGLGRDRVYTYLGDLVDKQLIVKAGRGEYRPVRQAA
jgi:hypothetical protein